MSEHLYLYFKVKPVIVVKHPVSFIVSLKRVNWWPSLSLLSYQPYLSDAYFSDHVDLITRERADPILEGAAFWRAVHKVLFAQANKYPEWQVITHERGSQNPVSTFRHLYRALELP